MNSTGWRDGQGRRKSSEAALPNPVYPVEFFVLYKVRNVRLALNYVFLLGRVLFSTIFIIKSFEHFSHATILRAQEAGIGMAQVFVPLSGIIVLLGGLSLLLGYKAKKGAWLLVIFLLPTTFLMHNYWKADNPFALMMHHYCFWKNISLLGAAIMITHFGSGPLSLDKHPNFSK